MNSESYMFIIKTMNLEAKSSLENPDKTGDTESENGGLSFRETLASYLTWKPGGVNPALKLSHHIFCDLFGFKIVFEQTRRLNYNTYTKVLNSDVKWLY